MIGRGSINYPRLELSSDGLTNLRMYGSKAAMCRNAHALYGEYVRISKIGIYENPYTVTGCIKHTGPKQEPKGICTDKSVGTWETMGMRK